MLPARRVFSRERPSDGRGRRADDPVPRRRLGTRRLHVGPGAVVRQVDVGVDVRDQVEMIRLRFAPFHGGRDPFVRAADVRLEQQIATKNDPETSILIV